jgi:hypothetical protein
MVQSCPVLSVGNPGPGDNIGAGAYVISGAAFDPAATSGSGISGVQLFLGERDQGGLFLGSAVPGSSGMDPRAWSVEVTIPSNFNRGVDFAAYAQSSVSNGQTSVTIPVFVGDQPRNDVGLVTPTPEPGSAVVTSNCPSAAMVTSPASSGTPAAVPSISVSATSAPAASAPAAGMPATTTTSANACPVLSLANPNPGDTLTAGNMFISGLASVPGNSSGSGVSRVDLFLGARDDGGSFLGSGVPGTGMAGNPDAFNVEVTVPNLGRGVDFAAYAIGANGQEQVTTFPVFVGAEPTRGPATGPTPTPIPATQIVTSTCTH